MTPKRVPIILVVVLALGVLLSACGSPPPGPTASPGTTHRHVTATEPPLTTVVPPTTLLPTTVVPSTTLLPTTVVPSTTIAPSVSVPSRTAPTCSPNLASQLASTGWATQLVVVDASVYATTYASLSAWQRQGSCWVVVFGPWTARIGGGGFSDHHVEGDDTTPTGGYGIGSVMYGNAPNPGVQYPYHQLVCGDWWDEDPSSPQYNSFQHVPCGETPPFGGDSEALWQETTAYPSFAVVDYNTSPPVPGAGSGIFIHANLGAPTAGCVSLSLDELDDLLRWLNPGAAPLVVMGPSSEIDKF